jgi:3-hydroxymyristoyl/3-hydroxydecanoyl-(acyl carrier protein) dehydratase
MALSDALACRFVTEHGERQLQVPELQEPNSSHLRLNIEDRYYFLAALLAAASLGLTVELAPPRAAQDPAPPEPLSLCDADVKTLDTALARGPERRAEGSDGSTLSVSGSVAFELSALRVAFWTSGSQAEPRRWEKSPAALLSEAEMLRSFWSLAKGERVICAAPPHHIYGFLWGVLLPLVGQASVFRGRARHAAAILEALTASNASRLIAVPAQLAALASAYLAQDGSSRHPLQKTRVISSGAPLDVKLAKKLEALGLSSTEILGSTETGGIAFRTPARCAEFEALPGVNLSASPGGLLVVTSPFVEPPGKPRLTADRVVFHGQLFRHLGRTDGTVKIGANRISLEEVVERARSIGGVKEVRALTIQTTNALSHALHSNLPREFWPKRVRLVSAMPVDERGKTPLRLLEALFENPVPLRIERLPFTGDSAVAEYNVFVPDDASCVVGHFPDAPIVPGAVLLGDAVISPARATWPDLQALSELGPVRFQAPLRAGETARVRLVRNQALVEFRVKSGNETLASGSILFTAPQRAGKDSATA